MAEEIVTESAFEWELNRENIQPIRGGRRAAALVNAGAPISNSKRIAMAEEKMAQVLSIFDGHPESDVLDEVLSFILWFNDHILMGKQRMIYEFLWKCVARLCKNEMYTDDERMLKVWIKMAENSLGNSHNIFDYANSIGSLTKCAQLYVEWSRALEERGAVDDARKTLERARREGATPITTINEEQDLMEMRILRKQSQENEDSDEELEEETEEMRHAFTRLQSNPDGTAPIVRIASISGEQGSSKYPSSCKKSKETKKNSFQVYKDEAGHEHSWLQDVYELRASIVRLNDDNSNVSTNKPLPGAHSLASSRPSFTVWQEGQTEEAKKPKARLMLKKEFIRDSSIEEGRVFQCSIVTTNRSSGEVNRPKNLNLSKSDIKPLCFD